MLVGSFWSPVSIFTHLSLITCHSSFFLIPKPIDTINNYRHRSFQPTLPTDQYPIVNKSIDRAPLSIQGLYTFIQNPLSLLIDTHSHIYHHRFDDDFEQMLQRSSEAGVKKIYLPNIDAESIPALKKVARENKQCIPMMGLHPSHVKEDYQVQLEKILTELDRGDTEYVAVGEIGIDLYWDKTFIREQQEAFAIQIEKAKEMGLPIVIHCREAFDEIFEVLEAHKDERLHGIFHCFTGDLGQAEKAIGYNMKLGIGGILTFKNGGLAEVITDVDIKHLVLETDAPYLAPMPHRGKRNEPAYVKLVAEKLAEIKGIDLEEVDRITTENAVAVFG